MTDNQTKVTPAVRVGILIFNFTTMTLLGLGFGLLVMHILSGG